MKRNTMILGAAMLAATLGWIFWPRPEAGAVLAAAKTPEPRAVVAAGRTEPASEEVKMGSELDGRLKRVAVEEGQRVAKGQIVAELDNGDYAARVSLAQANLAERQAALQRLLNGSRQEQRREFSANVREAEAVLENARVERERRASLLERGAISRTEFDSADREYRVAKARLEAAQERRAVVDDETRPEDKARAAAEVESARARLDEAQSQLAKTILRSPIDGVVLRRHLKTGESVSSKGEPIVTIGNLARVRVRVDVDESDVARLTVGQRAYVTAAAYGERKFTGRVVRIGQILGRKNVRTDEPTERVDQKILETLVELDEGQSLPMGLRVDAYLEIAKK
jgi:ABC exporter DevB family membrane fusion protein